MKPIFGRHPLVLAFYLVVLALILGIVALAFTIRQQDEVVVVRQKPCIGLVLYGGKDDAGWNRQHYEGAMAAAKRCGIDIDVIEHVTFDEQSVEVAMQQLARDAHGHDFIIASSAEFSSAADRLHAAGSRMDVALPKLDASARGSVPYLVRLYEGEYLAGILAGLETQTGCLGYVASTRNPEVCRSVNAFLLGARETRPDARLIVTFVGSWSNPDAEQQAAARLVEHGADILNSHQDTMAVQAYADAHGILFFDYLEPYPSPEGSGLGLADVQCRWDMVYERMLRDYLKGRFRDIYWIGIEDDAVGLQGFSPRVSEEARSRVEAEEQRLRENGSVFSGAIYDTEGNLRVAEGESLSDAALIHLDWYAEGVEFL